MGTHSRQCKFLSTVGKKTPLTGYWISMPSVYRLPVVLVQCLLVLVVWDSQVKGDDYCDPLTPGSGDPSLPTLDMTAFVTTYRVTIIDQGFTIWAKESYDSVENFVRVDALYGGIQSSVILDYANNTYIDLKSFDTTSGWECACQLLSDVPADVLEMYGFHQTTDGSSQIPSAPQILQMADGMGYKYISQDTFDGIPVDHWQSCQKWDSSGANFLMDYYFTTTDFLPADDLTPSQIPVKIEITGWVTDSWTGENKDLHHVYQYLDFHAVEELPGEVYSLPDYVTCTGPRSGRWSRSVPDLPSSMSYTVETVITTPINDGTSSVQVDTRAVYHDTKRKLIRVDTYDGTSISDFNTGLEYVLDGSGCTTRMIDPDNVLSAFLDTDGYIKMQNCPEIEYLSKYNHEFTGNKPFRDIQAIGFSSESRDEGVETFYTDEEHSVPLGVRIKDYSTDVTTQYNIFGFVNFTEGFDKDPFEIKGCEIDEDPVRVTFYLYAESGSTTDDLSIDISQISLELRDLIASAAEISIIQIYPTDCIVDSNELYYYFTLLEIDEDTPVANVENKVDLRDNFVIFLGLDDSVRNGKILYSYGDSDLYKFLATSVQSEYVITSAADPLKSFMQSEDQCVTDSTILEPSVTTFEASAADCAQACLDQIDTICKAFQYVEDTQSCLRSGLETTDPDTTYQPGCDLYTIWASKSFVAISGTTLVEEAENSIQAKDYEECARLCVDEKSFDCESFDYCCEDSNSNCTCSIYRTQYFTEGVTTADSPSCVHYFRDYEDDYQWQGYIAIDFPGAEPIKIEYSYDCSYRCSNYDKEDCAMFTFCNYNGDMWCTLVPVSQESNVQQTTDTSCYLYTPKGIASGSAATSPQGSEDSSSYTSNQMAGLAFGMVITGVAVGVVTVFLLSWLGIWKGFQRF